MVDDLSRVGRLHARVVRRLLPVLDPDEVLEAARVFDALRHDARRRSVAAWLRVWIRETRALAVTAWSEWRDVRRRSRSDTPDAWPGGAPVAPSPTPGGRRRGDLERLGADIRQGARRLARTPLFTIVSVVSLALGITAAVAVFSTANAVMWQTPSHVADPGSLVRLFHGPGSGVWSYPDVEDTLALTPALGGAAAFGGGPAVLTPAGQPPRRTIVALVSPSYFDVLGVPMARGRGFVPADLETDDAAVISHGLWRGAHGARPDVLGQRVEVNGRSLVIIGVAPPGLRLLEAPLEPDVWQLVPRDQRQHRGWSSLHVVGRLAPGATLAQLRAQLEATAGQLFADLPAEYRAAQRGADPIRAYAERDARLPVELRSTVYAGLGGTFLVILMILGLAASNVAHMMLTRASERQAEIATRLALGATRRQLVGQLLVESLIVVGLAGVLGVSAVALVADLLSSGRFPWGPPVPVSIDLDWRVTTFALGVTLVTGLAFGLAPALHASRLDVLSAIKGVRPSARLPRFGLRSLIVTAQVAGSLALVVTALLFLRSYQTARAASLGFDPTGVVAVPIDLTQRQYSAEAASRLFAQAVERMTAIPGVESVALARTVPLSGTNMLVAGLEIDGRPPADPETAAAVYNVVGPGYFSIVRMPLLAGREFTAADRDGAPQVAIVNEAFVNRFWPDGVGIGRRVDKHEVVGVVRNASYTSPGEPPRPHLWVPLAQSREQTYLALARTNGDPAAVGRQMVRIVHGIDPMLLAEPTSLAALTSQATLVQQLLSIALGAAGLVALALAMTGVYGVMAYVVSLRTREMGIRVALGARPAVLAGMVVREGLGLTGIGLCAGTGLAILAGTVTQALLVGVGPFDPASLAAGAALLALAAAAASYLPARRAARVDPIVSLRVD